MLTIHDVSSFTNTKNNSFTVKWVYKLANLILTHNNFSKEEIMRLTNTKETKIKIIPHGNYRPFIKVQKDKNASRTRLKIPSNKKVLLFFGMIKKVKGLEVLLRALIEVKQQQSDVILLIAGKVWKNDLTLNNK